MKGNAVNITPAYNDIVIRAKGIPDNILANKFNVKYLCILYVNDDFVVLKAPPNADINNMAYFKVDSIIQDYVQTDYKGYDDSAISQQSKFNGSNYHNSPHAIHQIDEYAKNKSNLKFVYAFGGYEYSDTATGQLVSIQSLSTDVHFYTFNAVAQHSLGFSPYIFDDHFLTGNTKKFLTEFNHNLTHIGLDSFGQKIQLNQHHTVAFLNGKYDFIDSEVTGIKITTFDSNNVEIATQTIENTLTNGGAPFGDTIQYSFLQGTGNTEQGLLYFGCGTAQLSRHGFAVLNIHHYTVQAMKNATPVSRAYRFDLQPETCAGYETIRLAFLNSFGAYDYYNFTMKSTRKQRITKSAIKQNYGHNSQYAAVGVGRLFGIDTYNQGNYDGGTRTYNVKATEVIEANTDFITEDESAILEKLFTSPDVYMETSDGFLPVVINETEYIKQTNANDKLRQYFITIEKGHETRVQRL